MTSWAHEAVAQQVLTPKGYRLVTQVDVPGKGVLTCTTYRNEPWTAADAVRSYDFALHRARKMVVGERTSTRRIALPRGWRIFVHVNTGPPTWWRPRLEFHREVWTRTVMVGWLRGLIAIGVGRESGSA